jgi:glycosyltransferase involved in cell wall biosynthesis
MIRIATAGNTNKSHEFGGTPSTLITKLMASGIDAGGINLRPRVLHLLFKAFWLLLRVISRRKPKGFQFSETAVLLRRVLLFCQVGKGDIVISFFQICTHRSAKVYFLIDGTLSYLFEKYSEVSAIAVDDKNAAIERERDSYSRAQHIFCRSQECADQLIYDYGIPANKVSLLNWGPNFELELSPKILENRINSYRTSLNLLFIGKDAQRKGLDKVLVFKKEMERLGHNVNLNIIGLEYSEIKNIPMGNNVHCHGHMNPQSRRFSEIFELSHLGFLVSRKEALGIAALEYQAAGLPTILSGVDGMLSALRTSTCLVDPSDDLAPSVAIIHKLIESGSFDEWLNRAHIEFEKACTWNEILREIIREIEA